MWNSKSLNQPLSIRFLLPSAFHLTPDHFKKYPVDPRSVKRHGPSSMSWVSPGLLPLGTSCCTILRSYPSPGALPVKGFLTISVMIKSKSVFASSISKCWGGPQRIISRTEYSVQFPSAVFAASQLPCLPLGSLILTTWHLHTTNTRYNFADSSFILHWKHFIFVTIHSSN